MRAHSFSKTLAGLVLGAVLSVAAPAARAAILGASLQVGTPGYGGTVWTPVAGPFADLRLGFNTLSIPRTIKINSGGGTYGLHVDLRSLPLLLDWYPFGFGFHLTGGVVYNDNHADYTAVPQNGVYVIDGQPFPAAALGTLSGTISYPHLSPYVGLGFGDPFSGVLPLFFTADFGAFYQKTPNVTLVSSTASGNPAVDAQLAAEAARIQSDIGKYHWYPVISLGIGVSF